MRIKFGVNELMRLVLLVVSLADVRATCATIQPQGFSTDWVNRARLSYMGELNGRPWYRSEENWSEGNFGVLYHNGQWIAAAESGLGTSIGTVYEWGSSNGNFPWSEAWTGGTMVCIRWTSPPPSPPLPPPPPGTNPIENSANEMCEYLRTDSPTSTYDANECDCAGYESASYQAVPNTQQLMITCRNTFTFPQGPTYTIKATMFVYPCGSSSDGTLAAEWPEIKIYPGSVDPGNYDNINSYNIGQDAVYAPIGQNAGNWGHSIPLAGVYLRSQPDRSSQVNLQMILTGNPEYLHLFYGFQVGETSHEWMGVGGDVSNLCVTHGGGGGGGSESSPNNGGMGGGAIAGIVIGSLVGVCGLGFCLRFLKSRRSDTQHLTELTLPGIKGPEDGTEQSPGI
jgi:hypothetical protein